MTDELTLSSQPKPLVSVIVPTLNEEKYIERCLRSLLAQDYGTENMEVLVADGQSTDQTRAIVSQTAQKYPQVRLLDNPRRITPAALNVAIGESKGAIICRIDAHCEYPANYVSLCVQVLQETRADNVGGAWITLPGADTTMAHAIVYAQISRFGLGGARYRLGGGKAGPVDTVPFGTFRRDVFDRVGLFDEDLLRNQDNELNSRIIASGGKVYYDPRIQLKYFSRPTLKGFLTMLAKNGLYHWLVLKKTPEAFRLRHMIPFFFVICLALSALGGLIWWPIWLIGCVALGGYLLGAFASAMSIAKQHGWRFLFVMPYVFLLSHLSYGIATGKGLVKFGLLGGRAVTGRGDAAGR